jgi:CheY-like chemotaxis protein
VQTILVASDAPTLRREIEAVISGPDVTVRAVTSGPEVVAFVTEEAPDLVIVDMQMGNMGGMAVCLELRLQESYDALDHVAVLMLLDRRPDVFLARRSGAEGWLVKPLDPLRLRRAVTSSSTTAPTPTIRTSPCPCWWAPDPSSRRAANRRADPAPRVDPPGDTASSRRRPAVPSLGALAP